MEIYLKNLQEAEQIIPKIEKMIVLVQISKNKNLILMTLEEIEKAIKKCINSILYYENYQKKIPLYKDPLLNFKTFENKSARNFLINLSEINTIKEILNISKEHKESSMEFMKKEDVIILSKEQEITKISLNKLTHFLKILRNITQKTKTKING